MQILGIHIDPPFLRAALIKKDRKGAKLLRLKSTPLLEPGDVKQLYTPKFKGKIASGLASRHLFIRSLEIGVGNRKHLEEIVAFQSEAESHFEPSEVLSVPAFLKRGENKTEATLFTASRAAIRDHLLSLEKVGIDPDLVSAAPLALVRFAQWKIPSLTDALLIDIGSSEWTCTWMENGQLKKSYSVGGGVESLLSSLWEDRKKILLQREVEGFAKHIDLLQLNVHLYPHLSAQLNEMKQELTRVVCSLHRTSGAKPVLFTGRIDTFTQLKESLLAAIQEFVAGESAQTVSSEELKHATAIGLALDLEAQPLQFRREEFFFQKNWSRSGAYALLLIAMSLSLCGAIFSFGNRLVQSRKEEMISSLQSSLDRSFKQSIFSKGGDEESILNRWSQAVSSHSKEYPFILQAPKVSEMLCWLSNHPLLIEMKKENDPIEILAFRYQLLQFPKIGALKEPYQAKVEIEFKTKNPTSARKMHEALLQGDERVDAASDVNWDPLTSDTYRVSFYLKNRSAYVP